MGERAIKRDPEEKRKAIEDDENALKNIRTKSPTYTNAVNEITGGSYSPEAAKAVLIHFAVSSFDNIGDTYIVLGSWALLQGYQGLSVAKRREKLKEDIGYQNQPDTLRSVENKLYKIIATNLYLHRKNQHSWKSLVDDALDTHYDKAIQKAIIPNVSVSAEDPSEAFNAASITPHHPTSQNSSSDQHCESSIGTQQLATPKESYTRTHPTSKRKRKKTTKSSPKEQALVVIVIALALLSIPIITHYTNQNTANWISDIQASQMSPYDDLIFLLEHDMSVEKNVTESLQTLEEAAKSGEAEDLFVLASAYLYYDKYDEAIEPLLQAASQGHAGAELYLGYLYLKGYGVPQNYQIAFSYFQSAVDGGNVEAIDLLGVCYQFGYGTEPDCEKAIELYQQAIDLGSCLAMNNLASMYINGEGIEQNYQTALELFMEAYKGGYALAAHNIGYMYQMGLGVPKSIKRAIKWYSAAADAGCAVAMVSLGYIYSSGEDINTDYQIAFTCFSAAAELGEVNAYFYLGEMYLEGLGVDRDYDKAAYWLTLSQEGGNENASHLLDILQEVQSSIYG